MKTAPQSDVGPAEITARARTAAFWLSAGLLVATPLAFSSAVHRIFSLPKFALLIAGSSALAALIGLIALTPGGLRPLRSKHFLILSLYMMAVAVSTIFGVARMPSLFGSFENQMGLITRLCFFLSYNPINLFH